jgi:hypothetical protein
MSLTKLYLGGNNDAIYKLFPPRDSLVSNIPAGDGNIEKLCLRCNLAKAGNNSKVGGWRKCGYAEPCMLRRGRSLLLYSTEAERRLLGRLEPGTEVSLQAGSRPRDFHHVSLEDEGRHYLSSTPEKSE